MKAIGVEQGSGRGLVGAAGCARASRALLCSLCCAAFALSACAAVRPEQKAILADPIMQFAARARAQAALQHVLENREGSDGGGAVNGGGCGCN